MSKTIPQELVSFKSVVSPSIDSMEQTINILKDKLTEIMNANDTAKNGVDKFYVSQNKDQILSSFAKLNGTYTKASTTIETSLTKIITDSRKIIANVTEMEKLIENISEKEQEISREQSKQEPSYSVISSARSAIASYESRFDILSTETQNTLNALKSMDESLKISQEAASNYSQLAALQTGGKIIEGTFKASNGIEMPYCLYIPEFSQEVTGLPLNLYLHSDNAYKNSMGQMEISLPGQLRKGLNIPGIVIMPKADKDGWWRDSARDNRDAAVELTKYIAEKYNCDKTRISASGYSNGGCGVHHMVKENTDLFASYVSLAGATAKSANNEAIGNAKVYTWGFHGTKDKNVDYSNSNGVGGKETYERIAKVNPEGTEFTTLEGKAHNISEDLWTTKYSFKGKEITPIEWLLTTKKYGT